MSERVVISAAHCFSNSTSLSHSIDVSALKVAAGKYKRRLDAEEDLETQIRDVVEVRISQKADIATVKITGHFEYRPHIAPACLKFSEDPLDEYMALVPGWVTTKVGTLRFPFKILINFFFFYFRNLRPARLCSRST